MPDLRHRPTPSRGSALAASAGSPTAEGTIATRAPWPNRRAVVARNGNVYNRAARGQSVPGVPDTPATPGRALSGLARRAPSIEPAELARRVQQARDAERAALARELHDELGAVLTAARLDLAWLAAQPCCRNEPAIATRLDALKGLIAQGADFKRRIVEDLQPSLLAHLGLKPALEQLIAEWARRFDGRISCEIDDAQQLDASRRLALYRLVQEALTNILKYARASRVRVRLVSRESRVWLSVADDGIGFEPDRVGPGHHGLRGLDDRLHAIGANLEVRSMPGRGTLVQAWVDLAALPDARALPAARELLFPPAP